MGVASDFAAFPSAKDDIRRGNGGCNRIEGETEGLDTDAVDAATEEMDAEVSFSDLLAEILSGEFDFTFANIKEKALELTFGELAAWQGRHFGTAGADCHSECNSEAVQ